MQQEKYSEAEEVLREACAYFKDDPEAVQNCHNSLGFTLVAQKKFVKAEQILLSSYDWLMRVPNSPWPGFNRCSLRLHTSCYSAPETGALIVRMYEEWGKPEQAAAWKAMLQARPPKIH
jgi:hypothetical protein